MTDTSSSTQPGAMLHALVTQLQTLEQTLQAALTSTNGATETPSRLPPAERHRRSLIPRLGDDMRTSIGRTSAYVGAVLLGVARSAIIPASSSSASLGSEGRA